MRGKEMLDAVGYLDETLILKAERPEQKKSIWKLWTTAACICLLLGGLMIPQLLSGHTDNSILSSINRIYDLFNAMFISENGKLTDDDYIAQIADLPVNDAQLYASFESLDEMIESTHANVIVRCTVAERGDCIVYDPWGSYSEDDLDADVDISVAAQRCLSTSYTLTISDCYLGNLAVGDEITFYAPYGILDGYTYRKARVPLFGVGAEYILVLRAEEINGEIVYNLSYTPDSVYVVANPSNSKYSAVETAEGSLFYVYRDDVSAVEAHIRALVSENNYNTTIEKFTSGKNKQ